MGKFFTENSARCSACHTFLTSLGLARNERHLYPIGMLYGCECGASKVWTNSIRNEKALLAHYATGAIYTKGFCNDLYNSEGKEISPWRSVDFPGEYQRGQVYGTSKGYDLFKAGEGPDSPLVIWSGHFWPESEGAAMLLDVYAPYVDDIKALMLKERKNPRHGRLAPPVDDWVEIEDAVFDADSDEDDGGVDDWVEIEECDCPSCCGHDARENPAPAKQLNALMQMAAQEMAKNGISGSIDVDFLATTLLVNRWRALSQPEELAEGVFFDPGGNAFRYNLEVWYEDTNAQRKAKMARAFAAIRRPRASRAPRAPSAPPAKKAKAKGSRGKTKGDYADIPSLTRAIEEALEQHGVSPRALSRVYFTRGGKSRAGACAYSRSRKMCRIMLNGLAWPAFTKEQRFNIAMHEAAHAIQYLKTGRSDHGPEWKAIARSIGCDGDRCTTTEEAQRIFDAYAEAKGLPKTKVMTKEEFRQEAEKAGKKWKVGDYVEFDFKNDKWVGKIIRKGPMRATVYTQSSKRGASLMTRGAAGRGGQVQVPYPMLRKAKRDDFVDSIVRGNPSDDAITPDDIEATLAEIDAIDAQERAEGLEPSFGFCHASASYIADKLGGRMCGYDLESYEGDEGEDIIGITEGGHDFAVLPDETGEDRWLVDWWAGSYYGEQAVYDLKDAHDAALVAMKYLPPSAWGS